MEHVSILQLRSTLALGVKFDVHIDSSGCLPLNVGKNSTKGAVVTRVKAGMIWRLHSKILLVGRIGEEGQLLFPRQYY